MFIFKSLFLGQSIIQGVCGLFAVGFFGAIISGIGSIIGGSKAKKAAKIAAENQRKAEALAREMQRKREAAAGKKRDWIMKLAMIGGGVLILIVVIFMFKKKRR